MPYQEHACRLEDPKQFDSFARKDVGEGDNRITLILAKKAGDETQTTQAIRYAVDIWSTARARAHCKEKGGTFEAAVETAVLLEGMPGEVRTIFMNQLEAAEAGSLLLIEALVVANQEIKKNGWGERNGRWVKVAYSEIETHMVAGVPIFTTGTHNGDEYTVQDLENMVAAFHALKGKVDPPVKVGHTSDEFNRALSEKLGIPQELVTGDDAGQGAIALGWIENLRRVGEVLYADLSGIPTLIRDLIDQKMYKKVSAEIIWNHEVEGVTYSRVLVGMALLGAEIQAVPDAGLETAAVYTSLPAHAKSVVFTIDKEDPVEKGFWLDLRNRISTMLGMRKLAADPDAIGRFVDKVREAYWSYYWTRSPDQVAPGYVIEVFADYVIANEAGMLYRIPFQVEEAGVVFDFASKVEVEPQYIEMKREEETMIQEILKALGLVEGVAIEAVLASITELKVNRLVEVAKALNLGEEATVEQITTAITGLREKVEPPEVTEYSTLKGELAKANIEITELKRKDRLAHFAKMAAGWKGVSGTPDEIAEKLVVIEELAGADAVSMQVEQFSTLSESAIKAGLFVSYGTPLANLDNSNAPHPFMVKVEERITEKKISEADAFREIMNEDEALWREYMNSDQRVKVYVEEDGDDS